MRGWEGRVSFHLFCEFSLARFVGVGLCCAFLVCLLCFGLAGENSCVQLPFHFFCGSWPTMSRARSAMQGKKKVRRHQQTPEALTELGPGDNWCGLFLGLILMNAFAINLKKFGLTLLTVTFNQTGRFDHSVFDTFVQLTEGRSARDQPKQPPAKTKGFACDLRGMQAAGQTEMPCIESSRTLEGSFQILRRSGLSSGEKVSVIN